MITAEQHARIRRLFHAEHWKVGTISIELGLHPDTVKRALETPRFTSRVTPKRSTMLDPYKAFILQQLEQHSRLRSSRLYEMVRARGYAGSQVTVRRYVRTVRPAGASEAYLALETLPGEQGQVDWGHFGKIRIGSALRTLSLFVMVLSYCRAIFARFFLDQRMESFTRGHVEAFQYFGGAPRVLLYDNLKSVVLDRMGEHVRFHPHVLELAGHYHFEPRPCAPYRGNEKGKVERAIQYIRTSFFAARQYRDVQDLNTQLRSWMRDIAQQRRRPTDPAGRSVAECFEEERPRLLPLPEHVFSCDLAMPVQSGKRPYVRFDKNDYSIPHTLVKKPLTLVASEHTVRVVDGEHEVALHARSYDRMQRVEDRRHLDDLARHKRAARDLTGRDKVHALCPAAPAFFKALAERGANMGSATVRLLRLIDQYGAPHVNAAIVEALQRGAIGPSAVAHICDAHHCQRGAPPPLPPIDSSDPRVRDLRVVPHDLTDYDQLGSDRKEPTDD